MEVAVETVLVKGMWEAKEISSDCLAGRLHLRRLMKTLEKLGVVLSCGGEDS